MLIFILVFVHVCLLVEGLEKSASLASCDVGVEFATNTQNAPASRQQRGKLSSLGKLFKPWKWRKKKTSDKFQDLSKGGVFLSFASIILMQLIGSDLFPSIKGLHDISAYIFGFVLIWRREQQQCWRALKGKGQTVCL